MPTTSARDTVDPTTVDQGRPSLVHDVTVSLTRRLMAARGEALVSLLMTTTPARRMLHADVSRLRELSSQAVGRLGDAAPRATVADVTERLERLLDELAHERTDRAVAVYAGGSEDCAVRLPLPVRDRAAVDPSFATRDLVRALHRTPRHVVLVVTSREARLLDGVAGVLSRAGGAGFPLRAQPRTREQGRVTGSRDVDRAYLRAVDRALGAYLAEHPAPLVLVGPERLVSEYRKHSRHLGRLAGVITGSLATASLRDLQQRIRPVLDAYLHSRQDEALDLIERRAGAHRVASGIQSAWLAARHEDPEMLAVEEGLYLPVRLDATGDFLTPAHGVEHPDVLDDAVDELIELVLSRGGWIALVDDGLLAHHDGVALTIRRRTRT